MNPYGYFIGDELTYLNELKNKRISIGEEGSGVRPVAMELLTLNGIDKSNSDLYSYSTKEGIEKLKSGDIDIFFAIASPQSETIRSLLLDKNIKIMNLKRAKAYRQAYFFYKVLTLGEGSIYLQENIPAQDIQLF